MNSIQKLLITTIIAISVVSCTATANHDLDSNTGGGNTYSISGNVAGLIGGEIVTLQNNDGDNLNVNGAVAFTFSTKLASRDTYSVTVKTNPVGKTCTPTFNSGTVVFTNITNVAIDCTVIAPANSVSGAVTLAATKQIKLWNNGTNLTTISGTGVAQAYSFSTLLSDSAAYNVTIASISAGYTCTFPNTAATGFVGTAPTGDVTNVDLTCALLCGNLTIDAPSETCDNDSPATSGDGCSATCQIEGAAAPPGPLYTTNFDTPDLQGWMAYGI